MRVLTPARSTRFIIFDEQAKIITEHQTEYPQILPHAGWHEQNPIDLMDSVREVINNAVEKLEWMGWHRDSVKGIGITNQRETTVAWSKATGQPLCNAIVWDDTRTVTVVRQFEEKLEAEGIAVEGADGKTKKLTGRDALVNMWVVVAAAVNVAAGIVVVAHADATALASPSPPTSPRSSCAGCSSTTRMWPMLTSATTCCSAPWTAGLST